MHRHRGTRWDTSVENSDPIVLEEDSVEPWRSDHGVEAIGPRPGSGRVLAGQLGQISPVAITVEGTPVSSTLAPC